MIEKQSEINPSDDLEAPTLIDMCSICRLDFVAVCIVALSHSDEKSLIHKSALNSFK